MNGVRLKAADTASDLVFGGYLNFNENIQDTDNYVLIVTCRNRSKNTHAHLPPVLWPLGSYF